MATSFKCQHAVHPAWNAVMKIIHTIAGMDTVLVQNNTAPEAPRILAGRIAALAP